MSVLEVEVAEQIALVRLNRPRSRNALDPELVVRLVQVWEAIQEDGAVRVVILTATEGTTFCAGFDLQSFIPLMVGARQPEDEWDRTVYENGGFAYASKAMLRDFDLNKPLIIAANGHAIAAGMELLLAGDIRIGAAGARLGLSEVRLGLIPAMGGSARLARQIGSALAAEMLLTGAPINTERALAAGLLNRVVAPDQVLDTAMKYARTIAGNAPLAVSAARDIVRQSLDMSEFQALELESMHVQMLALTQDAAEGARAFAEKRAPEFKGR